MRCCKDIGIASELWDPDFIKSWKSQHAVQVWAEHTQTGRKQKLWRKHGADRELAYPWKETGVGTRILSIDLSIAPTIEIESDRLIEPWRCVVNETSGYSTRPATTTTSAEAPTSTSSSAATTAAAAAASDFDPNSMVPPTLKKLAGKTWADVVTDPASINYLRWAAENAPGHGKAAAAAALAWWNSGMPSKE